MLCRESAVNNILAAAYKVIQNLGKPVSDLSDEEIGLELEPALEITRSSVNVAIARVQYSNSILNYFYEKRHGDFITYNLNFLYIVLLSSSCYQPSELWSVTQVHSTQHLCGLH